MKTNNRKVIYYRLCNIKTGEIIKENTDSYDLRYEKDRKRLSRVLDQFINYLDTLDDWDTASIEFQSVPELREGELPGFF